MSKPIHSYTVPITLDQAALLRKLLESSGFEFPGKPYAIFSAKREKLSVTVYEKGPKVLVQGKETADFVQNVLEPDILGEARLGKETTLYPERFEPHIGVDESGKGDYFGPLVVGGVYVDGDSARELLEFGIADSKRITSDSRIRDLAEKIRTCPGVIYHVLEIPPAQYNESLTTFRTVNNMLAWGHASVIETVLTSQPDCPRALSDQFTDPSVLLNALQERGRRIVVDQRTKAESDIAVAAASILAREAFIDWIDEASEQLQISVPKGAANIVKDAAREVVSLRGRESLVNFVKLHFQTTDSI